MLQTTYKKPDALIARFTSTLFLVMGSVAGAVSMLVALRNSVYRSQDFQWSDVHLLVQHHDPWATYLAGDPRHEILLTQIPNYLHELYVLMLPFGDMTFSHAKLLWAFCNLCFIGILVWSVTRLCELTPRCAWLLLILLLVSTPFRVTIGNGQNDALALMAISLWAWTQSQGVRGLLLGVSYEKYSFPPVLVVFLLVRRRWKLLGASLIPPVFGFLIVNALVPTDWRTLILEPFRTAVQKGSVSAGWANIAAVIQRLVSGTGASPAVVIISSLAGVIVAVALAVFFAYHAKSVDGRILLACLVSASLICFQHQIYDFLALIFNLAIALKSKSGVPRTVVFCGIAYFWYLERIFTIRAYETTLVVVVFSFLIGLLTILGTYRMHRTTEWSSRWEI